MRMISPRLQVMVSALAFIHTHKLFLLYLFLSFLLLFSCSFSTIYANLDAFSSRVGHMRPHIPVSSKHCKDSSLDSKSVSLLRSANITAYHITSSLSRFKSYMELLLSASLHTLIAQHLCSQVFLHRFVLFGTQFPTVRTFQPAVLDAFFLTNRKFSRSASSSVEH